MNFVAKYVYSIKEWTALGFARLCKHSKIDKKKHVGRDVERERSYSETEISSSRLQSNDGSLSASDDEIFSNSDASATRSFVRNSRGKLSIGTYEVQRTLGVGKQARVLLAKNLFTGDLVALKVLNTSNLSPKTEKYAENETRALRTIIHPNVLQLREVFFDVYPSPDIMHSDSATVMVLDYCPGGELFDIMLSTGGFSETLARTYFLQIASAINACHEAGIYHRDIKPQNILLDSKYQVKISDFGVCAMNLCEKDICETFCGTLGYMAPEVIAGHSYSGEKVDAWSLGIVLFILLAGNPPLRVATGDDWWFKAILTRRMEKFWHAHERMSPDFPKSAQAILSCLLVADPNERSSVKDLFSDPWLKGPCISPDNLNKEMSRRHQISKMYKDEQQIMVYRNKQVEIAECNQSTFCNDYYHHSMLPSSSS